MNTPTKTIKEQRNGPNRIFLFASSFLLLCILGGGPYNVIQTKELWRRGLSDPTRAAEAPTPTSDVYEKKFNEATRIFLSADVTIGGLTGILLDLMGPRYLCALSCMLMAISWIAYLPKFMDKFLIASLAIQGSCVQGVLNSVLSVGNLFPSISRTVLSTISGGADLAGHLFYFVNTVIRRQWLIYTYSIYILTVFSIAGTVFGLLFLRSTPFEAPAQEKGTKQEDETLIPNSPKRSRSSRASSVAYAGFKRTSRRRSREIGVFSRRSSTTLLAPVIPDNKEADFVESGMTDSSEEISLWSQMMSPAYILFAIAWFGLLLDYNVVNLRIDRILEQAGDDGTIAAFVSGFMWITFFTCVIFGGLTEIIGELGGCLLLGLTGITMNAASLVPLSWPQWITCIALFLGRSSVYNVLFMFITNNFDMRHFGTLSGVAIFTSGIALNYLTGALETYDEKMAKTEHKFWQSVNFLLLCITTGSVVIFGIVGVIVRKNKTVKM